jgi:hypothetical protein
LHKSCSENAHGWAQNVENVFGFGVLARYHKGGDETWVSFANIETKEPSKQDIIITPHMRTTAVLVLMTVNEKYEDGLLFNVKHFMRKILKTF